jgi:hypothetical protein
MTAKKKAIAKSLVQSALSIAQTKEEAEKEGRSVDKALKEHVAKAKAKAPKAKAPKPETKPPEPEPKPETKAKATPSRLLYTIRLEPELIKRLQAEGEKRGVSHATVAREIISKALK